MNLQEMYATAAKRLPDAKAISIMCGVQTWNEGETYEWWTILVYSTDIGPNSIVTEHVNGESFDAALDLTVKRHTCSHQWIASYTGEDQVDGYDCPICGKHRAVEEDLKEGE